MSQVTQKYKHAVVAADIVVFAFSEGKLQTLLIQMTKAPFKGSWAAPGGLVKPQESVDDSALRLTKEKASITPQYIEQVFTFGKVNRDPFGRVVSVAYMALLPKLEDKVGTASGYSDIKWFTANKLPRMAYDHAEVVAKAVERLQGKLIYTNIAYSLMPKEFTLTELQNLYEAILGKPLDKRNFRKKILSSGILKNTKKMTKGNKHRPAELYTFTNRKLTETELV